MKSFVTGLTLLISLSLISTTGIYAADSWTTTLTWVAQESSSQTTNKNLLIEKIDPVDTQHIDIVFNQAVIRESVRVRVTKQSDESNVRIDSFTGGENTSIVSVVLAEPLIAGTAYKLTIVSAISDIGIIIKDGADGIKEFTTAENLKTWMPPLNAPTNTNAIKITSWEAGTSSTGTTLPKTSSGTEKKESLAETAKELPLSGMNSTLLIILAWFIAWIFLLRRKHV